MRHILPQVGQLGRTVGVERGPGRVALRLRQRLYELVPDIDHGNAVERQHRFERLNAFLHRKLAP